jgi:gas vesicle protein
MMNTDPDEIRTDIEYTRRDLGNDVDALAEKVTPSKIMHRQTSRVKDAIGSAKERVFGVAHDAQETVGDALSDAPRMVSEKAKGNPIAAGLIAFGVGWLASSLVPASEKEKQVAGTLQEKAKPLASEVTDAAKQMADDLRQPAEEAVNAVKESATDAAETVKQEGTSTAEDLKSDAASRTSNPPTL